MNGHLVLEQASPAWAPSYEPPVTGTVYALILSARTEAALADLAAAYGDYLATSGRDHEVRDICYSAAHRRHRHSHRLVVTGSSHDELADALRHYSVNGQSGDAAAAEQQVPSRGAYVPLPSYPWQLRDYPPVPDRGESA